MNDDDNNDNDNDGDNGNDNDDNDDDDDTSAQQNQGMREKYFFPSFLSIILLMVLLIVNVNRYVIDSI